MRLPARLPNPRRPLQIVLVALWIAIAAIAAAAQLGGIRTGWVEYHQVDPAFAWIGMDAGFESIEGATGIDPVEPAARWRGYEGTSAALLAVNGRPVDGLTPDRIAPLIPRASGVPMRLTLRNSDGVVFRHDLRTSAALHDVAMAPRSRRSDAFEMFAWPLASIPMLIAGGLLLWRHRGETVPVMLAFAFAALAPLSPGALSFLEETGYGWIYIVVLPVALACFSIALPAFPDGVFMPRAARWMIPITFLSWPVTLIVLAFDDALALVPFLGPLAIAVVLFGRRYRGTPRGIERQQIKWATFGVLAGALMVGASIVVEMLFDQPTELSDGAYDVLFVVGTLAGVIGFVLVPLGFIMSLMRWKLNDADAVIGQSLGYAAVTIFLGVFWAVAATLVNGWLNRVVGIDNPAVTTATSTLLAALIFTPARSRMLAWTEARFQAALVRLRALPARLARRQAVEPPETLAAQALASIVRGVDARCAAIVWFGEPEPVLPGSLPAGDEIIATADVDEASAAAHLLGASPLPAEDDPFPLRFPLTDDGEERGLLALGPRGDGSPYSRLERIAVESVIEALTEAIQASQRTVALRRELLGRVSFLQQRLDAIEASAALPGPSAAG